MHESLVGGGHFGFQKTYEKIRRRVYFPNMVKIVRDYVKYCETCQFRKRPLNARAGLLQPIKVGGVFETMELDVQGPFRVSSNGMKYIVSCQDYLTKYLIAKAIPNESSEEIAKFVMEDIVCVYGAPQKIISDRGRPLISKLMQDCYRLSGTQLSISSGYRPETAGGVEKSHQMITNGIAKVISADHEDWHRFLPYIVFNINVSVSVHGYTPFYLMFARQAQLPSELAIHARTMGIENATDYVAHAVKYVKMARELAAEEIRKLQKKYKTYYDKNHFDRRYYENDLVLVRYFQPCKKGLSKKFCAKYYGPFRILSQIGPVTYVFEPVGINVSKNLTHMAHVSHIEPFYSRETEEGNFGSLEELEDELDHPGECTVDSESDTELYEARSFRSFSSSENNGEDQIVSQVEKLTLSQQTEDNGNQQAGSEINQKIALTPTTNVRRSIRLSNQVLPFQSATTVPDSTARQSKQPYIVNHHSESDETDDETEDLVQPRRSLRKRKKPQRLGVKKLGLKHLFGLMAICLFTCPSDAIFPRAYPVVWQESDKKIIDKVYVTEIHALFHSPCALFRQLDVPLATQSDHIEQLCNKKYEEAFEKPFLKLCPPKLNRIPKITEEALQIDRTLQIKTTNPNMTLIANDQKAISTLTNNENSHSISENNRKVQKRSTQAHKREKRFLFAPLVILNELIQTPINTRLVNESVRNQQKESTSPVTTIFEKVQKFPKNNENQRKQVQPKKKRFIFLALGIISLIASVVTTIGVNAYTLIEVNEMKEDVTYQQEMIEKHKVELEKLRTNDERIKHILEGFADDLHLLEGRFVELQTKTQLSFEKTFFLMPHVSHIFAELVHTKNTVDEISRSWSHGHVNEKLFALLNITLPCGDNCPIHKMVPLDCSLDLNTKKLTLKFEAPTINSSLKILQGFPFVFVNQTNNRNNSKVYCATETDVPKFIIENSNTNCSYKLNNFDAMADDLILNLPNTCTSQADQNQSIRWKKMECSSNRDMFPDDVQVKCTKLTCYIYCRGQKIKIGTNPVFQQCPDYVFTIHAHIPFEVKNIKRDIEKITVDAYKKYKKDSTFEINSKHFPETINMDYSELYGEIQKIDVSPSFFDKAGVNHKSMPIIMTSTVASSFFTLALLLCVGLALWKKFKTGYKRRHEHSRSQSYEMVNAIEIRPLKPATSSDRPKRSPKVNSPIPRRSTTQSTDSSSSMESGIEVRKTIAKQNE